MRKGHPTLPQYKDDVHYETLQWIIKDISKSKRIYLINDNCSNNDILLNINYEIANKLRLSFLFEDMRSISFRCCPRYFEELSTVLVIVKVNTIYHFYLADLLPNLTENLHAFYVLPY